ncbi:MAG TPA: hypothetical protein VF311_13205 [Terriglobales bacterium]
MQPLRDAVGAVTFRFLTQTDQPSVRFRVQMQQSSKHRHSSYQKYAMPEAVMSLYLCATVYEIGHAHARSKRVVLYRKAGTKLHFDIAHRKCPEYDNITDLKQQLRKRMETLTNKPRNT